MRKFNLVDFAAHYQKGFRNHVVAIGDVPALVESFKHYGCYATYFFFSDEVFTYMSTQAESAAPSIAGYEGKVWAPFFPIDLDHPQFIPALEAARRLSEFFHAKWQVGDGALHIYFSGAKGFHLLLDTRLFGGLAPAKNLPVVFDSLRRHLAQELPEALRATVDLTIKDRVRLLRLPNTIHEKSKLYKIILNARELENLAAEQIRELARQTRTLEYTDATGFVARFPVAVSPRGQELYERIRRQSARLTRRFFEYRFRRPPDPSSVGFRCAGIEAIWRSRIDAGYRNNCAIRLASEFRLLGLSREETEAKLLQWNEQNGIELSSQELRSVAHSAYQRRFPYRYGCRDPILRRFCPLPDLAACERYVTEHAPVFPPKTVGEGTK